MADFQSPYFEAAGLVLHLPRGCFLGHPVIQVSPPGARDEQDEEPPRAGPFRLSVRLSFFVCLFMSV